MSDTSQSTTNCVHTAISSNKLLEFKRADAHAAEHPIQIVPKMKYYARTGVRSGRSSASLPDRRANVTIPSVGAITGT